MAVGLFGDLGETLSQKCMTFHPRGNTISGVENGDIYIWSNGVVNAKIEKAHKTMVCPELECLLSAPLMSKPCR